MLNDHTGEISADVVRGKKHGRNWNQLKSSNSGQVRVFF